LLFDVDVQDAKKLLVAGGWEMVQALPAHVANSALGDGIGVRRLNRRGIASRRLRGMHHRTPAARLLTGQGSGREAKGEIAGSPQSSDSSGALD
jgi:hypothetical protein